jgi:hypothetical protein
MSNNAVPPNCPLIEGVDLSNRKRVSKACLECKKRHCRCDHQRPCSRCTKLGYECIDAPTSKRGPPKGTCYKKRKRNSIEEPSDSKQKNHHSGEKRKKKKRENNDTADVALHKQSLKQDPLLLFLLNNDNEMNQEPNYSLLFETIRKGEQDPITMPQEMDLLNITNLPDLSSKYPHMFIKKESANVSLQSPKNQKQSYDSNGLTDIEDMVLGMCMNTSCSANRNHHCMFSELNDFITMDSDEEPQELSVKDDDLVDNSKSSSASFVESNASLKLDLNDQDLIFSPLTPWNNDRRGSTITQEDTFNFLLS